jgi:hypothetical protein
VAIPATPAALVLAEYGESYVRLNVTATTDNYYGNDSMVTYRVVYHCNGGPPVTVYDGPFVEYVLVGDLMSNAYVFTVEATNAAGTSQPSDVLHISLEDNYGRARVLEAAPVSLSFNSSTQKNRDWFFPGVCCCFVTLFRSVNGLG